VDLFATELNTRCDRFYSRRHCPGALATNARKQSWAAENSWANPPFHLLGAVVKKIVKSGATATLIAPIGRAQPWWAVAEENCFEWEQLSTTDGVYTHGLSSVAARRPFWKTAVFRFAPDRR